MSEHTNERTETHACDSISRQKAINTVKKMRAVCDTDSIEDYEALLETAFEVLPSAQPEKTQLSKEDATFDCISRKAAIDAFRQELVFDYEEQCTTFTGIKKILEALPSAQPNMQPTCNKLATDSISRQAAISVTWNALNVGDACKELRALPSEQSEIIYCKDCKHRPTLDEDGEPDFPTCRCPCQCEDFYYSWMPKDDWFCGNAERREE